MESKAETGKARNQLIFERRVSIVSALGQITFHIKFQRCSSVSVSKSSSKSEQSNGQKYLSYGEPEKASFSQDSEHLPEMLISNFPRHMKECTDREDQVYRAIRDGPNVHAIAYMKLHVWEMIQSEPCQPYHLGGNVQQVYLTER